MINPSKELQTAINAVKAGSELALSYFQKELTINLKKDNSLVTNADFLVEEEIKRHITKNFPKAKFLAEESGGNIHEKECWIIDPIDGTRVFTKRIPLWSILIAHYVDNEVTCGVCYIPSQNTLIAAEKGKGAYRNGKRIRVSKTNSVNNSFGNFGSLHRFSSTAPVLKLNDKGVVFRSYEHAYAFSFFVAGDMDLIIDGGGTPWDYAPFACIVPEAGGKLTDLEGKEWHLNSKNLLATNGILHDEILKIINKK